MKKEHKYAQALRWIADGENLQIRWGKLPDWLPLSQRNEIVNDEILRGCGEYEFRIKPRTVMCNGVEVPAPEIVAPSVGKTYYVPDTRNAEMPGRHRWVGDISDKKWLSEGLVYLDSDACLARTKAMLITS